MKQCNNKKTSNEIYNLFIRKLKEFKNIGKRNWGDPAGVKICDTYEL